MLLSKKAFLISISLLLILCPCKSERVDTICERTYNLCMQTRGYEITGICVMNISSNGDIVGTIVNEFGIKAFDFIYNQKKVKILNVISPLDKWFIRNILRRDFRYILSDLKRLDMGATIERKSRKYLFTPIDNE